MLYTDEGGGRSGSPEPNEIIFFPRTPIKFAGERESLAKLRIFY